MDRIRIAKQLVAMAKSLMADDAPATTEQAPASNTHPFLAINVTDADIRQSKFYEEFYKKANKKVEDWKKFNLDFNRLTQYSEEAKADAKSVVENAINYVTTDMIGDGMEGEYKDYADMYVLNYINGILKGLRKLAKKGQGYISGNFDDFSEYYNAQPMNTAQDAINAAYKAVYSLGTYAFDYNLITQLDEALGNEIKEDMVDEDAKKKYSEEALKLLEEEF